MNKAKLAIIGSGPAGYTAGIYASRAQLQPILFSGLEPGGQLMWTSDVENYPGFPQGVDGKKLMADMRSQAERFGTKIEDNKVTAVDFSTRPFKIWTDNSEPAVEADAVIIATGAGSIPLNVPGEKEFLGRGVSTCAVCDAAFFKDKITYVVGGGDSAMEDTLALTKFASQVTVIHRRGEFRASKIMQERVLNHPKVKVLWNTWVVEIVGDQKVTGIKIANSDNSQLDNSQLSTNVLPADGVFVAVGHRPMSEVFKGQLVMDDHGYIVNRQSATRQGVELAGQHINDQGLLKYPTTTSVEGVFVAGDVTDVRYKQAVTSAGSGCQAALDAERWLESQE